MRIKIGHIEGHKSTSINWLRAAVLGANDGIVSTAGVIVGVAAAHGSASSILIAGVASLVAGAMSMAAGEYVSVSSQSDTEKADLAREKHELETNIEFEREELTQIYINRGLDRPLAEQVSQQLMAHNALDAHARDELGILEHIRARPLQAAIASALAFTVGALVPLAVILMMPATEIIPAVAVTTLVCLAMLGALAAYIGGAGILRGTLRVLFWGALALGITTGVGSLFGV